MTTARKGYPRVSACILLWLLDVNPYCLVFKWPIMTPNRIILFSWMVTNNALLHAKKWDKSYQNIAPGGSGGIQSLTATGACAAGRCFEYVLAPCTEQVFPGISLSLLTSPLQSGLTNSWMMTPGPELLHTCGNSSCSYAACICSGLSLDRVLDSALRWCRSFLYKAQANPLSLATAWLALLGLHYPSISSTTY